MRVVEPDLPLSWLSRSRFSPYLWLIVLWVLLIVPTVFTRGAHSDEGTTIGLARGAFEDGFWLDPHLYGMRLAERPALMSWLLGVLGLLTGDLRLWVARVPAVLSLLGGGCLVYWLVRQAAGKQAAVFGAMCFLLSPLVLPKVITAGPGIFEATLLFAAFVAWWTGHAKGDPSVLRWAGIGVILAAAGLVKGPAPLGFFFLGVGIYLILCRRWRELAGLLVMSLVPIAVIGSWYAAVYQPGDLDQWYAQYQVPAVDLSAYLGDVLHFAGEMILDLLPGLPLVVPLAVDAWRGRIEASRELVVALFCYAGAGTLFIAILPEARTLFAMPAIPAVAAVAGIGFQQYVARRPMLASAAQGLAAALLIYALASNWFVLPLFPYLYEGAADDGRPIARAILERPAPVYAVPSAVNRNILYYLPRPRLVSQEGLARSKPPFWAIVTDEQERALKVARPDLEMTLRLNISQENAHLVEVTKP